MVCSRSRAQGMPAFLLAIVFAALGACRPAADAPGSWPLSADGSERVRCQAVYRLDCRETPPSVEIFVEREGWRLREVGRPEVFVSSAAVLLERLEEISARSPSERTDISEWFAAGSKGVGPFIPDDWDRLIPSLAVAVHSPGDAPISEVFALFRLLTSDGVRASRQAWWIREPGRVAERVGCWMRIPLNDFSSTYSGPVGCSRVGVSRIEENDSPRRWRYRFGLRETARLEEFKGWLDEALHRGGRLADSPLHLSLPADAEAREIAPVLRAIAAHAHEEVCFGVSIPGSLAKLLELEEGRELEWWWPEVYRHSFERFGDSLPE